jgi:tetratricopeptide (TPR) repeat protein
MKTLFVLIGLCIHLSFAQTEFDSLSNLRKAKLDDSTRYAVLTELAYTHYPNTNPAEGLTAADEALALANLLGSHTKRAYAYRCKGINYWALSEYAPALEQYSLALHEYETAGDDEGRADTYNNIGVVYYSMAAYTTALDYYLKALPIYERTGNRRFANVLTNIGIIYKNLSEPARALEYYRRALLIYEKANNRRGVAQALANIGNAYDDLDSTVQALDHHRRAALINQALGNIKGWANNLNSIGIISSGVSDYPRALQHLQQSLHLYGELGDKNSMSVALMEIGKIYRQASEGFLKERGIEPSMRYPTALAYTRQALQLAEEIGARDRQAYAYAELASIYEQQCNYAKALDAFRHAVALRESVASETIKSQMTTKTMQFEFDKKEALLRADHQREQELAFEKLKQQRIQNNSVMGGTALLLLGGVTTFLLYKKRADADRRRKEAEFRTQVAETEMRALRAQINPHFIFNSLNSINDYIGKHDTATADYYLTKFAKLMRLTLENSDKREVALADDLHALELYMQLEALRLNNKFTYNIYVEECIDRDATLVPPLLLQPFVENSIWHGLAGKPRGGRIDIRVQKKKEMLLCSVEDNGRGRHRPAAPFAQQNRSLGLKITRARIDILNQTRGANAAMDIVDLPEGVRVEVRLPFIALEETR